MPLALGVSYLDLFGEDSSWPSREQAQSIAILKHAGRSSQSFDRSATQAGLTGRNAQPDETRRIKVDKKDSASETGSALLNLETENSIEDVSRNNLETNAISHL